MKNKLFLCLAVIFLFFSCTQNSVVSNESDVNIPSEVEKENHKKTGTFDTLAKIADALNVEPYELLLPQNSALNLDSRKTKQLMKQLRKNVCDTMDTIEKFLSV